MIEDAKVRGGLVLSAVLVAVGLAVELLLPHSHAVGFGVICGGWSLLVLAIVRSRAGRRLDG